MIDSDSHSTEKDELIENLNRCLRYLSNRAWVKGGSISERYNSHVGLVYLLFCHHYGITVELYSDDNISQKIQWILLQDKKEAYPNEEIKCIALELLRSIGSMSLFEEGIGEAYLRYIKNYLFLSDKYYSEVIEHIINFAISEGGAIRAEYGSYTEIAQLLGAISKNLGVRYLFDPCAGYCSIPCYLKSSDIKFIGHEINHDVALLSSVRLLAHEIDGKCIATDSSKYWLQSECQCDTLVSDLPFGVRIPATEVRSSLPLNGRRNVTMEELVISDFLATSSLRKAIITVPPSFCVHDSYLYLRNIICESNILSDVIILPENTRPGTSVQSCVLVLNKDKSCPNVRFIDASQMVKMKGRATILDLEMVMSTFLQSTPYLVQTHIRQVSNLQIIEANFNFNPLYYTFDDKTISSFADDKIVSRDGYRFVQLGDILETICPEMESATHGKVIKISDIRKPRISCQISSDSLSEEDFTSRMQCLDQDCIVVTKMTPNSATMLSVNGNKVFSNPGRFFFFKLNDSQVDPLYLIGEISKSYFQRQIKRHTIGKFAKIDLETLLHCKIKVPSLEQQKNDWINSQIDSLKSQSVALMEISDMQHQKFVRNQRQRKHATIQVLNELLPALDTFIGCIKRNGTISLDTVVSPKSGRTVEQYLYSMKSSAEKVSRLVERYTELEEYPASEVFEVNKIIQDYCNTNVDDNYRVFFTASDDSTDAKVNISKQHFIQIFDNLFANAKKHGFVEDNRHDYAIRVEVCIQQDDKSNRTCAIINVANNGVPVSESISLDKLFAWGIGNGDGIGCYQARDIAEYYGGDLLYNEYLDDPEGFVCEFRIVLPLYME